VFFTGFTHIRWSAHPGIQHRIEIPANGAEGPICAIDGVNGGRSLYIKDHLLVYCYNYLSKRTYIRSTQELAYKLWIS